MHQDKLDDRIKQYDQNLLELLAKHKRERSKYGLLESATEKLALIENMMKACNGGEMPTDREIPLESMVVIDFISCEGTVVNKKQHAEGDLLHDIEQLIGQTNAMGEILWILWDRTREDLAYCLADAEKEMWRLRKLFPLEEG